MRRTAAMSALQAARFGCVGSSARKIVHLDLAAIGFQGGSRFCPHPAAAASPVDMGRK
jgi:hypothetical protein